MKKVILMRGLPGSGKSTYAKQLVDDNPGMYKRINRDDLRAMFDNGITNNSNEKFIKQVRDMLIVKALADGKHVIVDDTNLSETNETRIKQLVHQFNKEHNDSVAVEVKEMETSLEESLARDAKREKPVGDKVIRQMHRQFYARTVDYVQQDESLPKALMCDLDGTLAILGKRGPFDEHLCESDDLNKPVANVLLTYAALGYKILLLSGRRDSSRVQTENWLKTYNIPYEVLLMRAAKDARKDSIVKREIFDQHVAGKYFVEFVLDDRDQGSRYVAHRAGPAMLSG
ncbi:MAG: AAA family ATPase [Sphingobacteriales bacterium JAD_PAG50586_3]|nr:MAG: AAA family ATPase [Sphingobacteriales bacterium JAD_PAG50586_3]